MEKEKKNNLKTVKKNKNETDLSRKEKKDILIYSLIFIAAIVLIIVIILLFIKGFKNNKENVKLQYQKELPNLDNKFEENSYINDRDIKKGDMYSKNYMFFAKNQQRLPKLGDTIFEIKFENFDPIRFKIFTPNVPKLALDLEDAVKNNKLDGKKANNIGADDKYIYVNYEDNTKIWSILGRKGMDLKLIPIFGSLVVNTELKYGPNNYGGAFKIVTSMEDQKKLLKEAMYPNELQEVSKKYNGTILQDYGKNAVIGQIYQGKDTLMMIQDELNKLQKETKMDLESTEKEIRDKKSISIEYTKIYEFEG